MQKVDELVAGRELDALVAEKVMGWLPIAYDKDSILADYYHAPSGHPVEKKYMPAFSKSITLAWNVVEKLISDGFKCSIFYDGNDWLCVFDAGNLNSAAILPNGNADTAPRAICKAALKVMENKDAVSE